MSTYYDYLRSNLEDRRQNRYAVVIYLPSHLDEIVAPMREKYDPLYNLVSSHITLVFPFASSQSIDELAGLIRAETDSHSPAVIELESIGDFYPQYPVIYWKVKKNDDLNNLYSRLYSSLGLTPPHQELKPHVTVAREISHHRVVFVKDRIVSYLPSERFVARKLDLIAPMLGDKWVSVRTFSLSGEGFPFSR